MKFLMLLILIGCQPLEPSRPSAKQIESCEKSCVEKESELSGVILHDSVVTCICSKGCGNGDKEK